VIAVSDVYVLPSFTEGVPRSIVEAMALNKAVVATRVGGVAELLGEGAHGLLVAPGDVDGLAEAMGRLAGDPAARRALGNRAGRTARAGYAFDSHVEGLRAILDEV
jgi:glycosyltransferase involved in cell wall biosynthesis